MSVFVSVSTNAFEEVFNRRRRRGRKPLHANVRRPLRGIEIKEDTYSVMKIITQDGEELELLDSSAKNRDGDIGKGTAYANYIIQSITEQRVEKQQIVETFGEDFIFFFGERPRFLAVKGILLNTSDFNWKAEFWENYDRYLRGTRLVENNARLYLYFDDVVVEGYLIKAFTNQTSTSPYQLPFRFQMFVTNYANLSSVGSVFGPFRSTSVQGSEPIQTSTEAGTARQIQSSSSQGSLHAFLAEAQSEATSANFSIQSTLENIKRFLYTRNIAFPDQGIGNQIALESIRNEAQFQAAKRGVPIHKMQDEYIESDPQQARFDQAEIQRVQNELKLRSPEALEARARADLASYGITLEDPGTQQLLLGRAAFAGLQVAGSFGMRKAPGELTNIIGAL